MTKNDRLQALRILLKILENGTQLTYLLQSDDSITPLTKAICYGVCRHYFRLESIADVLVEKRPQGIDLWLVLLIGLYQLQFMDKPEYATVKETVALVDKLKKPWAKGLVNAVLRRFCRERAVIIGGLESSELFVSGHPDWFIQRIQQDWPDCWQRILNANDAHPPMSLRVNRQRVTRDEYLARLQKSGINARPLSCSAVGIVLDSPCEVAELPGFAAGDVSVQDEAAQLAVTLLSLQPGFRVLDVCAAPGGKTCHILEAESKVGECVALDIDASRLQRVRENLQRLHLQATVCQGDALQPAAWWDGQLFDRILLDAPCSATGVIRRHPDIKLLRTEKDVENIAALQASILKSIWPLLRPGGVLIYATCSVLSQENEQQMESFIRNNPDCQNVSSEQPWGRETGHGRQLLPGDINSDGFFYSVLQKVGWTKEHSDVPINKAVSTNHIIRN